MTRRYAPIFVALSIATAACAPLRPSACASGQQAAVQDTLYFGTAKPTAQERQQVPHHLLDLVNPNEEFSLSEYVAAAHAAVAEVRAGMSEPIRTSP